MGTVVVRGPVDAAGGPHRSRRPRRAPVFHVVTASMVLAALLAAVWANAPAGAAPEPRDCGVHGSTPVKCWVVDSFTDGHDQSPGDGRCASASDACTLRAAVEEAVAGAQYGIQLDEGTYRLTLDQLVVPKADGRFIFITITGKGPAKDRKSGV